MQEIWRYVPAVVSFLSMVVSVSIIFGVLRYRVSSLEKSQSDLRLATAVKGEQIAGELSKALLDFSKLSSAQSVINQTVLDSLESVTSELKELTKIVGDHTTILGIIHVELKSVHCPLMGEAIEQATKHSC